MLSLLRSTAKAGPQPRAALINEGLQWMRYFVKPLTPSSFLIVTATLKGIKSHDYCFMDFRNSPERLKLLPKVVQLLDSIAFHSSG